MARDTRPVFLREMNSAKDCYDRGDLGAAQRHLERAHILGQLHFWRHMRSHWWMLKIAVRLTAPRAVVGQLFRMAAVVPGYVFGWVPLGNTGGTNVSPILPMPLPADLAPFFDGYSAARIVVVRLLLLAVLAVATALLLTERARAVEAAAIETEWHSNRVSRVAGLGATSFLEILPLVNWHAGGAGLKTEAGVSYLVRTDDATILFDLGWNENDEDPSPLLHNMEALGVSIAEIDAIFLSHAHRDHVGGSNWAELGTFSFGPRQISLAGKEVFAPVALRYPDIDVRHVSQPQRLLPGVATTGPIARSLFIGRIEEQALVVNVSGKGLVVIVGCGHQTLTKLLQRVDEAFEEPLFGIVGDLHYPVPDGRLHAGGIDLQHRFASGDGPMRPITRDQVTAEIAMLESRNPGLVSIGGHDTSDDVIAEFARRFGSRFRRAEVGTPIRVRGDDRMRGPEDAHPSAG